MKYERMQLILKVYPFRDRKVSSCFKRAYWCCNNGFVFGVSSMLAACIRHPKSSRYISLHEWQVEFCEGNHCAAFLLSFFSAWHDWKLKHDEYYRRCNDIAEIHGDSRSHNENAYMFFTTEQLMEGCLNAYGKTAISAGLVLLVKLGVISIHPNPNSRYHFDKTKHFLFYPDVCNRWIDENYINHTQVIDSKDRLKTANRLDKNDHTIVSKKVGRSAEIRQRSTENSQLLTENSQTIPYTTYNTTNKKKLINKADSFLNNKNEKANEVSQEAETLIIALTEAGMPQAQLSDSHSREVIESLAEEGATPEMMYEAYHAAVSATERRGARFGVSYVAKIIFQRIEADKRNFDRGGGRPVLIKDKEPVYRDDFGNARDWAADLIR